MYDLLHVTRRPWSQAGRRAVWMWGSYAVYGPVLLLCGAATVFGGWLLSVYFVYGGRGCMQGLRDAAVLSVGKPLLSQSETLGTAGRRRIRGTYYNKLSMSRDSLCWGYCQGVLLCCKVSTTYLKFKHTCDWSSNVLQWVDLEIARQCNSYSKGREDNMLPYVHTYCMSH